MIFVDTNVLIDVLQDDPSWAGWSIDRLADAHARGEVLTNAIVVAELSRDYVSVVEVRSALAPFELVIDPISDEVAFMAGTRFAEAHAARQRDAGSRPLPDFFIGAHALTNRAALLTRDNGIYRRHFPELTLITPETYADD